MPIHRRTTSVDVAHCQILVLLAAKILETWKGSEADKEANVVDIRTQKQFGFRDYDAEHDQRGADAEDFDEASGSETSTTSDPERERYQNGMYLAYTSVDYLLQDVGISMERSDKKRAKRLFEADDACKHDVEQNQKRQSTPSVPFEEPDVLQCQKGRHDTQPV